MSSARDLIAVPTAAMHAFVDAHDGDADVAVYLPTASREGAVLYREAGVGLSQPDVERLRQSGVSSLFLRESSQGECEAAVQDRLADVLLAPDISADQKAACIFFAGSATMRDLIDLPEAEGNLDRAWSLLGTVVEAALTDPALAPAILQTAARQRTTANHMLAVSMLGMLLGMEALGPDTETLKEIGLAGLLHDLGKMGIAPDVLNKPGPLDADERRVLMQHPIESVRMINDEARVSWPVRQMILQHHERVDGGGYPLGLMGKEMLAGSKILSIVDAFHAILGRPGYTGPLTPTKAVRVLASQAGRQLDAELLACWQGVFERHWREPATEPDADVCQAGNERAVSQEHRSLLQPRIASRRPPRFACEGDVKVGCVYAGRLKDVNAAGSTFVAPLCDVSKEGVCMRTEHPMYRGEVLNLLMDVRGRKVWVQGVVAWCRRQAPGSVYRSGLRLIRRISPDEARRCGDPKASTAPLTCLAAPRGRAFEIEDTTRPLISAGDGRPIHDQARR